MTVERTITGKDLTKNWNICHIFQVTEQWLEAVKVHPDWDSSTQGDSSWQMYLDELQVEKLRYQSRKPE